MPRMISHACVEKGIALAPVRYVRAIAWVAPYVGKEINPQRYCSQLMLPVGEAMSK